MQLLEELKKYVRATRAETECQGLDTMQSVDWNYSWCIRSVWTNEAAWKAHTHTAHYTDLMVAMKAGQNYPAVLSMETHEYYIEPLR